MSIRQFITTSRKTGLAKGNRFSVYFTTPKSLASNRNFTPNFNRNIALFCNRVEMPGISVSSTPIRTTGEVRNIVFDRNFESFSISFYADSSMQAKYFFDEWINSIQDRDSRVFSYYDEYVIPVMTVDMEAKDNVPRYRVRMYEVYPKSVSAITLDQANNGVVEINVTFEYKYWSSIPLFNGIELAQPNAFDKFISLVGTISNDRQGIFSTIKNISDIANFGSSVSASIQSFGLIAGGVAAFPGVIPPEMVDTANTSSINSIIGTANTLSNAVTNIGIQLNSPAGLNIDNAALTTIVGQFGNLNTLIGATGNIRKAITLFTPSSIGAIATQLGTISTNVDLARTSVLGIATNTNAAIQRSTNNSPEGVASNGPKQ